MGQAIGLGVIKAMLSRTDEWAYRIPYALQWMWPVPLMIAICFAPGHHGRWSGRDDTMMQKKALLRLTSLNRETDFNADETIAMMIHTNALEESISHGATYLDCFRGTDLRRTEIVCMVWAIKTSAETPSRATPLISSSNPACHHPRPTLLRSDNTVSTCLRVWLLVPDDSRRWPSTSLSVRSMRPLYHAASHGSPRIRS